MTERTAGLGKCSADHPGAYGYPARPEAPYSFCPECGASMIWACPECNTPLPEDAEELNRAHFCRDCGAAYFGAEGTEPGLRLAL